jgi:hypothetical protein
LRRPRIHKVFDCANEVGLTSLLVGEVESLDEALRSTEVDGLRVLPCGAVRLTPPSCSARRAWPTCSMSYRPTPILSSSTAHYPGRHRRRHPGGHVTGTILVAEAVRRAWRPLPGAELIKKTGGNLLGIVLNRLQ